MDGSADTKLVGCRVMTRVDIETASGTAWADIDAPAGAPVGVVFAGHGAGGGVDTPDLRALRDASVGAG